jgi:hypothetical protein
MISKNWNKNKIKVTLRINLIAVVKTLIMKGWTKKHRPHKNGNHKNQIVTVKIQNAELKLIKKTWLDHCCINREEIKSNRNFYKRWITQMSLERAIVALKIQGLLTI